jgi:hypothetical protein
MMTLVIQKWLQRGFGLLMLFALNTAHAQQDAKVLIRQLNQRMQVIQDYTASVQMHFDIPGVKMRDMQGKVFFKQPGKFKIKAKGIFFLPKQNPMQDVNALLKDTASYTTVISGYETIDGHDCAVVNVIPLKTDNELILGKFWIDVKDPLIYKSQMTTKNNGTLETSSIFGAYKKYGLPDALLIKVEVNKIKVPKMMSVDLNKKSAPKSDKNLKEPGYIQIKFIGYKINSRFSDTVFTDDAQ